MGSNTFRLVVFRYRDGRLVPARGRDPRRRAAVAGGRAGRACSPTPSRAPATPPASTRPSAPPAAWTTVAAVATSAARDAANARRGAGRPLGRRGAGRAHPLRRGGGVVRVPRGRQQHHPRRRLRARPGRRQRAGDPGGRPGARADRVAPARRRAHDRALPGGRAGEPLRHQGAAQARGQRAGRRCPGWTRSGGRTVGIGGTIRTLARDAPARGCATRSTSCTATMLTRDGPRGADRGHGRAAGGRAQPAAGAEAGPGRHHAGRRGRDLGGAGRASASTAWRSAPRGCARASSTSASSRPPTRP